MTNLKHPGRGGGLQCSNKVAYIKIPKEKCDLEVSRRNGLLDEGHTTDVSNPKSICGHMQCYFPLFVLY